MSEFVVVQTRHPDHVRALLDQCERIAQSLLLPDSLDRKAFGVSGVLGLGRRRATDQSGRLYSGALSSSWSIGAGTWVDRAGGTAVTVLDRLAASCRDSSRFEYALMQADGGYGFAAGPQDGSELRIATDLVGQIHIYCIEHDGNLICSTSAILLAQLSNAAWDAIAVREFLATGTVFGDRSLFQGVRKIGPARLLTCQGGRIVAERQWWTAAEHVDATGSNTQSIAAFREAIGDSVQRVYEQFPKPALDLTGGFDSRILLASARERLPAQRFDTVVAGDARNSDVTAAADIAARFGLSHRSLNPTPQDGDAWWALAKRALPLVDGEYDLFEYAPILSIHEGLSAEFDASVNGSGGELIRGYWWELLLPRIGARTKLDSERTGAKRFATDTWAESLLATSFPNTLAAQFAATIDDANRGLQACRNTAQMDNVYLWLRMQRWQGRLATATNRLWPCLSPLLFREPVEAALRAPIPLRMNGRMARRLIADIDRPLATMPMSGGYPALPITPRTLWRFRPLAVEYAERIGKRLPSFGRSNGPNEPLPRIEAISKRFDNPAVREMLDPQHMRTAELYESGALNALTQAIKTGETSNRHAGRLLTLEAVARLRSSQSGDA